MPRRRSGRPRRSRRRSRLSTARRSARWIVTGTTRNCGQTSIMTGIGAAAGQFGQIFGVPGMAKPGAIEAVLVDRVGDKRRRAPAAHIGDGGVDRADDRRRIGGVGLSRPAAHRRAERRHRKRRAEDARAPRRARRSAGSAPASRAEPPVAPADRDRRSGRTAALPRLGRAMPSARFRRRSRRAHPSSRRAARPPGSHPDIDKSGAPQVAQIAPRQRVEAAAHQTFGDIVARRDDRLWYRSCCTP